MGMILFNQATTFDNKIFIPFQLDKNDIFDNIQEPFYRLTSKEKDRRLAISNRIKNALLSKGYDNCDIDFWTMRIMVEIP